MMNPSIMLRFAVAAVLCLSSWGCLAGLIADRMRSRTIPAKYEPQGMLLVLVEPLPDSGIGRDAAERLAATIHDDLEKADVSPLAPQSVAARMQLATNDFGKLPPAQRARAVGADQVLHVRLTQVQFHEVIGGQATGSIAARVQMIDTASGATLWPVAQPYHTAKLASRSGDPEALYRGLGTQIGRLFHDWEP